MRKTSAINWKYLPTFFFVLLRAYFRLSVIIGFPVLVVLWFKCVI